MSAGPFRTGSVLSRIAFVLFNLLVLALVYIGAVEPTLAYFESQRTAIDDKHDVLDRYSRALERVNDDPGAPPVDLFLPGGTDARRSAALQDMIKRICERAGTRLLSVSGLSPSRDKSGAIGVRVDMSGPLKALSETVAGIEGASPTLAIGRATIRASAVRDEVPGELTVLEAQFDVFGFAAP